MTGQPDVWPLIRPVFCSAACACCLIQLDCECRKDSQFPLTHGLYILASNHQQHLQHLWIHWCSQSAERASHGLLCLQCSSDDCCIPLLCRCLCRCWNQVRLYSSAMWVQTRNVNGTQVLLCFRVTAGPFAVSTFSSALRNLLPNCRYSGEPAGLTSFERAAAGMQMHTCHLDNALCVRNK